MGFSDVFGLFRLLRSAPLFEGSSRQGHLENLG